MSPTPTLLDETAPGRTGFAALGVPEAMSARLESRGIDAPFPIQTVTIPPALAGRDVCGRAPTGSGKTLAFGIPLVLRVARAVPGRPRALVLAPTRELAAQIRDELRQLADRDQTIESFYGGVGFGPQLKALRRGVDVAVACPGRLADLVARGDVDLGDVDLVVLDEADRMADMGFLPEVRRLLDQCAPRRQTLLFSATLDGDVDVIVRRHMDDPVRHEESGPDEGADRAEHVFWSVERPGRVDLVARIVARCGPTVVFCRTKRGADRVARQLGSRGVGAVAIHGDRSQGQRQRALEDFRAGRAAAIVATDVAARGIHVDGVACVVHFDPSADPKDYVHRSGRTGRAGAEGTVVSLVPQENRRDVVSQQRGLGRRIQVVDPVVDGLPESTVVPAPARPDGAGARRGAGASPSRRPRNAKGRGSAPRAGAPRTGGPGAGAGGSRPGDGGSRPGDGGSRPGNGGSRPGGGRSRRRRSR